MVCPKWNGSLVCVPSLRGCCGSCEFFAVARSDNFSAAAVQAFCHLPEGSRCKGTSRWLRFSNVLQLFFGRERKKSSVRQDFVTMLRCYSSKNSCHGGCKIPLYLYIYLYYKYIYRYRIIFWGVVMPNLNCARFKPCLALKNVEWKNNVLKWRKQKI